MLTHFGMTTSQHAFMLGCDARLQSKAFKRLLLSPNKPISFGFVGDPFVSQQEQLRRCHTELLKTTSVSFV